MLGAHLAYPSHVRSLGVLTVVGAFRPNGSSAVDNTLNKGKGFTVARTSAGLFTVTLDSNITVKELVAFAQLRVTSGDTDGHEVRIGDVSATNRTFEVEHLSGTDYATTHPAAADIASAATSWINFIAYVWTTEAQGAGI